MNEGKKLIDNEAFVKPKYVHVGVKGNTLLIDGMKLEFAGKLPQFKGGKAFSGKVKFIDLNGVGYTS